MQINFLVADIHKGELGSLLSYSPVKLSSYFCNWFQKILIKWASVLQQTFFR